MKKVLVTGADGFIGSHLVECLVRESYEVRAFVLYNSFNSWGWLDHIPHEIKNHLDVFPGDIRDSDSVYKATVGCDAVAHLAALISIPYSYQSPEAFVNTNVIGTLNVLQAAKQLGTTQVIHTSTSEVYGTAQTVPISESHPLQAQSPYSASKISADQIALSFYRSFDTPVTILRPFNTYGPRQSARAVIPAIILQIMRGNRKISLGSLHPTRDFNFVKDTVSGFFSALQSDRTIGEVINIGSNFEISILDTVNLISELMGKEIQIQQDTQRIRPSSSEVDRLWADNNRAKHLLSWVPHYGGETGFRLGLQETIDWFSNEANRISYKSHLYNL